MIEESAIALATDLAERQGVLDITVLICEDDAFQRETLRGLFESANAAEKRVRFFVTIVESPSAALALLRSEAPPRIDLVLLDIDFGPTESSGQEMLPALRAALPPMASIVMLSVHQGFSLVHDCMSSGADAYLMKPIRAEEVRSLWQHCFRRQGAVRQDASRQANNPRALASPRGALVPPPGGRLGHTTSLPLHRDLPAASPVAAPSHPASWAGACDPGPRAPGCCRLVTGPRPGSVGSNSGGGSSLASPRVARLPAWGAGTSYASNSPRDGPSHNRPSTPSFQSPSQASPAYSRCRRPGNTANHLRPIHISPNDRGEETSAIETGCAQQ